MRSPEPPDYDIEAYDFELPPKLVAQEPLPVRDASRLLVLERATGALSHRSFGDLPELLRPGDLLVVNRSRVFKARLVGRRQGGGAAEILLVRRREAHVWDALLRPGLRLQTGAVVNVAPGFSVRIEPLAEGSAHRPERRVRFLLNGLDPDSAIELHGHVPLPPYIRRPDRADDRERYQTVYARETGSIAAPTAGLHFTPELLARLVERGVALSELVLHVGPGTFRLVAARDVREHRVPPESFTVPDALATAFSRARAEGRRAIAVGTTVVRALESALDADGQLRAGDGETALVIVPGFRFRAVDGLVTNFHLPRSSLLLLVAAFAGRTRSLAAYVEAVRLGYRFYSYGDAMLIV